MFLFSANLAVKHQGGGDEGHTLSGFINFKIRVVINNFTYKKVN